MTQQKKALKFQRLFLIITLQILECVEETNGDWAWLVDAETN